MKRKIAEQWITALRSGQYRQSRYRLRTADNKFCVLGVLCNLHAIAHPDIAAAQRKPTVYMGESVGLPEAVVKWAGMYTSWGKFSYASLSELNDNGVTFAQLSDIISQEIPNL